MNGQRVEQKDSYVLSQGPAHVCCQWQSKLGLTDLLNQLLNQLPCPCLLSMESFVYCADPLNVVFHRPLAADDNEGRLQHSQMRSAFSSRQHASAGLPKSKLSRRLMPGVAS